ncbi:hypothetical protein BJX65DRAFT_299325 [Aspergillus insuetus]
MSAISHDPQPAIPTPTGRSLCVVSISFDKHGCIYFKEDLRAIVGEAQDINTPTLGSDALERFSIGPLTTTTLWTRSRQNLRLDRGPCKLLEKYIQLAPYLTPQPSDNPSNIVVDPDTHKITSILDWQSARVAPLWYQSGVPALCRHPGPVREGWAVPRRPADFGSLAPDKQKRVDDAIESETLHKYYEAQVYSRAPRLWAVLQRHREISTLSLMDITALWSEFFPEVPSPIEFTSDEIQRHSKEEANNKAVGSMLLMFRHTHVLPEDRMVKLQDYALTTNRNRSPRRALINLAKDEEKRELFSNLWPHYHSEDFRD